MRENTQNLYPLSLLLLSIGVWAYDSYLVSSFYSPPTIETEVALDAESSLAMNHPIPADLVPTDLFEEIPGISSSTAEKLTQTMDKFCGKKKQSRWNWEQVPGVGEKRARLLTEFLSPPICGEMEKRGSMQDE